MQCVGPGKSGATFLLEGSPSKGLVSDTIVSITDKSNFNAYVVDS
jgi:hypothetical protein